MSDYLWDKTGEPEEDVAQLENLLGTLRYQPRPLEIPAAAMATVEAVRTRPATIFSRPRLAIAASLLLTLLAGAWFVTRQDAPPKNRLAEIKQGSPTGENRQPDTAVAAKAEVDKNASGENVEQAKPREKRVTVLAAASKPHRPARQLNVRRHRLPPRVEETAPKPPEEIAGTGAMRWEAEQPLTPQQREATEQLMFALRLASAKLNYAQREMQEIGRAVK